MKKLSCFLLFKFFFFATVLYLTPLCYSAENKIDQHAQKIIKDMDLLNKDKITKESYKLFLFRLVTQDAPLDESLSKFYNTLVDRLTEDAPEEFELSSMSSILDTDKMKRIVNEMIMENYGNDGVDNFEKLVESKRLEKEDL